MYNLSQSEFFCKLQGLSGGKEIKLKHFMRFPSEAEWRDYLKARGFEGTTRGRNTYEFANTAQVDDENFWNLLVTRVEGYKAGGVDIMTLPDWKEKVPIQHKMNAIGGFLSFTREEEVEGKLEQGEFFEVGELAVQDLKFAAIIDGNQEIVTFHFKNPSTSDYVKYNRASTKMQMTRTKQKGVSTIKSPVNINMFIEMFDRLIVSVDGYTFANKDKWVSEIPVLHKREAVRELFSGSLSEDEETGTD